MAKKYSNSIYSLENIEHIQVKDIRSRGMDVEVVYHEVEQCVALQVPIPFLHGPCSDVQTAVSEFNELADNAMEDKSRDRIEFPSNFSDDICEMTPELERDVQNLQSMINRSFGPDLISIVRKYDDSLTSSQFDTNHARMEGLNPQGFTILLSLFSHCSEEIKIVEVAFEKKCENLSDFQEEIGKLCI
eukprot:CAMPEP_0117753952 /NCGR_PEP_ID=MMETSP0947-20121206/12546_1 /TAXON_ID=44440 /ORGANISM="Chattonella subsalsa, Strain CCMP2191" /LENGTH=187 /DNA_ID=CAMNT_0005572961 /DNA_START=378 /DNA_END=941 /DNA_ORIENTATION=-